MKFLAALTILTMMSVAFAEAPKLGEDQKSAHEQLSGTECMAPACVQQRKDKADAERKKAQEATSSTAKKK
jgi:hypothetical protein